MKVSAIIPAAGQGKRMGREKNKQFLLLGQKPVLAHTLTVFQESPLIEEIVVVAAPGEVDYCRLEVVEKYNFSKVTKIITGGKERQNSVYNGLLALSHQPHLVVIHDGARPFLSREILEQSIEVSLKTGGAVVAVPVKDTIKVVNQEKMVESTPDRSILWAVQTPQTFNYSLLLQAYEEAAKEGFLGTDDASLVERMGAKVTVVPGSYENFKITTPEDLLLGEAILARRSEK